MKVNKILLASTVISTIFLSACVDNTTESKGEFAVTESPAIEINGEEFYGLGKDMYIIVEDDEVVDSAYLKQVLDGEIVDDDFYDLGAFNLKRLIKYMEKNNVVICPGEYVINQVARFDEEDGMFKLNLGRKIKIFDFVPKMEE